MSFFWGRLRGLIPSVDTGSNSPSVNAERRETRLAISAREYPRTLTWAGVVLLVMTVVTFFGEMAEQNVTHSYLTHVNDLAMVAILFISATVLRTDLIPRHHRAFVVALCALLLIWSLLWQVTVQGTALNYTYAMLVLIGYGATSLSTRPYLCTATLSVIGAAIVAIFGPVGQAVDWILVAVTAAGIGAILLRIRLQSIIALADVTELAKRLATQDQLTGVLNRHGLMEHAPGLWATAERFGEGVFAAFIDIRGLKQANDQFGHDYGDRIIRSAAKTATQSVRSSDLVARWGGDEFVVVGIGTMSDAFSVESRLDMSEEWTIGPASDGVWSFRIGFASGHPQQFTVNELIRKADEDMYLRRNAEQHDRS